MSDGIQRIGDTDEPGYIDATLKQFKALSDPTRIPQGALFREAVQDLLKKYEEPQKKAGQ